jgi:hypothetical protein
MLDQLWTFMQTLGKGILQGFKQYIDNDLQDQLPLIVFAIVAIVAILLLRIYKRIKNR